MAIFFTCSSKLLAGRDGPKLLTNTVADLVRAELVLEQKSLTRVTGRARPQ